jgi:hypothetical protein
LLEKSIPIPLRARTCCWKSRASETGIARDLARDSEAIRFLGGATSARLLSDLPSTIFLLFLVVRLLPGGKRLQYDTTSWWTQRHCEHLPTSTVNDYIEQLIVMNDKNRVAGASGTGPSSGYTFVFLFFIYWFSSLLTGNKMEYIYVITILLLYSWIKFNKNLPNFLTQSFWNAQI